jgi:hypothetical protein
VLVLIYLNYDDVRAHINEHIRPTPRASVGDALVKRDIVVWVRLTHVIGDSSLFGLAIVHDSVVRELVNKAADATAKVSLFGSESFAVQGDTALVYNITKPFARPFASAPGAIYRLSGLFAEGGLCFVAIWTEIANEVAEPFVLAPACALRAIYSLICLGAEAWIFFLAISAALVHDIAKPLAWPLARAG